MDQKAVENIRRQYPVGARVQVDQMGEDPHPIPRGARGTVLHVDDIATVHCLFDNGRQLGLIPGIDSFHRLTVEHGRCIA